ncbi:hypothetical protein [Algisphaera agarilytica]|uniref:Uncharacterized protein n=1 Tax=Algisphaera agarilytica TaxID=1385975 RepID=A0A7X0H8M3_9BACT|nr:hypothetical protein [Algisphaera agarilytica]MBB6431077.1 hypothetical protein [Algisphaera agarilytica]
MPAICRRSFACLWVLVLALVLAGCYEDEAEVTINADGSGSFVQTILISEQMVVAMMSEDESMGVSSDAPFDVSREELEAKLGDAGKITAFETEDLDDGSMRITVQGTFQDAAVFFGSEYALDSLQLGVEATEDGQAEVIWVAQDESSQNGPSLDQLYGMAKGLKIVRAVNLPSAPVAELGEVVGNRIEWAMDLSDRVALESTKAMIEASDDGVLVASFDPVGIDFGVVEEMPVVEHEASGQDQPAKAAAPVDTSGMEVVINTVGWTRYVTLNENAFAQDHTLSLDMELKWPEGSRPIAVYPATLTSLNDDLGNNLVREVDNTFGQNRSEIWEHSDTQMIRLDADGPDRDARALLGLSGEVRVVTQVNLEAASLDNPTSLVGKAKVGNTTLDGMGFKIKAIKDMSLELTFNEGVEATEVIESLTATLPNGSVVESNGWGGWANNMNYSFPEDVSGMKNLTVNVLTGETVVAVPFSLEKIELP